MTSDRVSYRWLLHVGYTRGQLQGMSLHESWPCIMPSNHCRWHKGGINGECTRSIEYCLSTLMHGQLLPHKMLLHISLLPSEAHQSMVLSTLTYGKLLFMHFFSFARPIMHMVWTSDAALAAPKACQDLLPMYSHHQEPAEVFTHGQRWQCSPFCQRCSRPHELHSSPFSPSFASGCNGRTMS